jgi:hypothetical protein
MFRNLIILLPIALLFAGCATTEPNAEFTKTIHFSSLQTFTYKHTLTSGMNFRDSEKMLLDKLTQETVSKALRTRGFAEPTADADFYVVGKWRKSIGKYANPFDHIDPVREMIGKRDPELDYQAFLDLTVEVYESASGNLFWRKELPNIFGALQLTEERIIDSVERALKNFPERIEKDPNLPDIG